MLFEPTYEGPEILTPSSFVSGVVLVQCDKPPVPLTCQRPRLLLTEPLPIPILTRANGVDARFNRSEPLTILRLRLYWFQRRGQRQLGFPTAANEALVLLLYVLGDTFAGRVSPDFDRVSAAIPKSTRTALLYFRAAEYNVVSVTF